MKQVLTIAAAWAEIEQRFVRRDTPPDIRGEFRAMLYAGVRTCFSLTDQGADQIALRKELQAFGESLLAEKKP